MRTAVGIGKNRIEVTVRLRVWGLRFRVVLVWGLRSRAWGNGFVEPRAA